MAWFGLEDCRVICLACGASGPPVKGKRPSEMAKACVRNWNNALAERRGADAEATLVAFCGKAKNDNRTQ